jgi:hypothetical protein
MRDQLQSMMSKYFKGMKYALFPHTVKYKLRSDRMTLTMNGIAIHVAKTADTLTSDFRAAMAKKWQNLTAKTGGTLRGKTFIPFGREGGMGDTAMTEVFQ